MSANLPPTNLTGEAGPGTPSPPPPPTLDFYTKFNGKILIELDNTDGIPRTDQRLGPSGVQTNWVGRPTREGRRKKEGGKRRQLVTDRLPKKGAKPCHKCDFLASQTVRRWRKLFLPSCAGGSSAQPLATPPSLPHLYLPDCSRHKPCSTRELKREASPSILPLPPTPRLFPEAKQQHGAVFVEAGVESCTERQQIQPTPSYHCNYAFHCPDTKDDRMCGIGPVFHSVSALFLHLTVSEKRLAQQGNARLVPRLVDRGRGGVNGAVVQMPAKRGVVCSC